MLLTLCGCAKKATTITTTTKKNTTVLNTTIKELNAPTNIKITEGIITFDELNGLRYCAYVIIDGTEKKYNIKSGFDLSLVLDYGKYSLKMTAFDDDLESKKSEEIMFEIIDANIKNKIKEIDLTNPMYVNWDGRNYYNEKAKRNYFYYTASGFKVSFYGTKLDATLYSNNVTLDNCVYIAVLVDGEVYPEGKVIALNKGLTAIYTLAQNLDEGFHSIQVIKRSEAIDNTAALIDLSCDGYFTTPNQDNDRKVLIIGDSFTAGFGNLTSSPTDTKTARNSDGLKSFMYLTARMFNADVEEISLSGWGVRWGYNVHNDGTINVPYLFNYVGITNQDPVIIPYATTEFEPDLILYFLGLNDFYAKINITNKEVEKQKYIKEFQESTEAFLRKLHTTYSNAKFVLPYDSLINQSLPGYYVKDVVNKLNLEFNGIYHLLDCSSGIVASDGLGASNHPRVITSIKISEIIKEEVKKVMGWQTVYNNITE